MFLEPAKTGLGKLPVHVPGKAWSVVTIPTLDLRQFGFGFGMHLEPLFGGEAGHVRKEKTGRKKEGALRFGVEGLDCPVGNLVIALVFVLMRKKPPIDELHLAWGINQLLFWERCPGGSGSKMVELFVVFSPTVSAMVDLAR